MVEVKITPSLVRHTGRLSIRYTPVIEFNGLDGSIQFPFVEEWVGESEESHEDAKRRARLNVLDVLKATINHLQKS